MTTQIKAAFEIGSWDETPFEDGDDETKLTEALVTKRYSGDIEGTSTTKWLMAYAPDKSATYVGIEHITGTIGGRRGGLVLMHDGEFADGVATAVCASCRAPVSWLARPEREVPRRSGRLAATRSRRLSAIAPVSGGNPPVATGPHRVGVTRIRHLPWSTIACRYSSQSGCSPEMERK